jgi:hypothetical protein
VLLEETPEIVMTSELSIGDAIGHRDIHLRSPTSPGVATLKSTFAALPPMLAMVASLVFDNVEDGAPAPSAVLLSKPPCSVMNTVMNEPAFAGLEDVFNE